MDRRRYEPGPATGARVIRADGDTWGLVLVRELRHAPDVVWLALTETDQLREWAPFDVDMSDSSVVRAESPRLLVYKWRDSELRWELEPLGDGTRLTLWTAIDRRYIAMGAAGWHVCIDVLDHLLAGTPLGRIAGAEALEHAGWRRLHKEYQTMFSADLSSL